MLELCLESISPVAFSLSKVGDLVTIKLKKPKLNEFRSKIGPATNSYLVFKNETKIGMIPTAIINKGDYSFNGKKARIIEMDEVKGIIKIVIKI